MGVRFWLQNENKWQLQGHLGLPVTFSWKISPRRGGRDSIWLPGSAHSPGTVPRSQQCKGISGDFPVCSHFLLDIFGRSCHLLKAEVLEIPAFLPKSDFFTLNLRKMVLNSNLISFGKLLDINYFPNIFHVFSWLFFQAFLWILPGFTSVSSVLSSHSCSKGNLQFIHKFFAMGSPILKHLIPLEGYFPNLFFFFPIKQQEFLDLGSICNPSFLPLKIQSSSPAEIYPGNESSSKIVPAHDSLKYSLLFSRPVFYCLATDSLPGPGEAQTWLPNFPGSVASPKKKLLKMSLWRADIPGGITSSFPSCLRFFWVWS